MTIFTDQLTAERTAQSIGKLRVVSKETRVVNEDAPPAYTTLTLLEDAAEKFGWSSERSIAAAQALFEHGLITECLRRCYTAFAGPAAAAQALFEHGLITYPRSDSTHIAPEAVESVRQVIREKYGRRALKPVSIQERFLPVEELEGAHEAIRPTDPWQVPDEQVGLLPDLASLYRLIWQRFVASEMQAARVQVIEVELETL